MAEIPVRFYRTQLGREPVLEWLRGLHRDDRRAIGLDLMRVQLGWPIGMPLIRSLKQGLWELRSELPSRRIARLLLCFHQHEMTPDGGNYLRKKSVHVGSSLDDFLREEGIFEQTRAAALKEVIAWQLQQAMRKKRISKIELARRMNTSRAALDRLLDPGNRSVTLQTLCRAAQALGRELRVELL